MNETDLRTQIREAVRQALNDAGVAASPDSGKPSAKEYFAPWTGISYEAHPSQQKLNIAEASQQIAAQLGNLLEFTSAQGCTIEKNKPCDQCGMCRSLGF
ncbi:MAG: hypothetical protein JNK38_05515 [Acidobacteria bacterium]|nr:hypothetical protein [Acidobacteriota bacterium]